MITKMGSDKRPIYLPDASDIDAITEGAMAPDCFGRIRRVVSVSGRGVDVMGNRFVCYHCDFGDHATISNSPTEGEPFSFPSVTTAEYHKTIFALFGLVERQIKVPGKDPMGSGWRWCWVKA